jgi:sugar transferase EpsL
MTFQLKKRLFDLAVVVPSVIILLPFLVVIGFLVRLKIGSPVLFQQVRPGLRGRPFTIYKFRTMTDERDEAGNLLPDGERLTPIGRFLRKTSMDPHPGGMAFGFHRAGITCLRALTHRQAQISAD